jgi:predicted small lipoprotein YifL
MKVILKSIVASVAVLGLAACSKGDLYDANQVAANKMAEQKQKFENNFEAKYGKVDPNQSWDFSTNQQRLGTRGEGDQIVTELVAGLDFGIKSEYVSTNSNVLTTRTFTKNKSLYGVLEGDLKDGLSHEGDPAVLLAPSTDFTIYPLSNQGGWTHKLYVKVGDNDPVLVYDKTWKFYGRATVNGDVVKLGQYWDGTYYAGERANLQGLHIKAPIGTRVDVYIDDIAGTKGKTAGTINGKAIYLDCKAKPEGITWLKDDAVIKYIGIEDGGGDTDYNDVVLAVVGNPFVPEKIEFTNNTYDVPLSVTKRYMMEDLGSTDDFDFNDVVVDVTETTITHHKVTLANGVVTMDEITGTDKTQKAVVRHLGGIYPFVLKVGNTTFDKMGGEDTFDKDVNIEKDVTGWDSALNNVSVTVEVPDKTQDSKMYNVTNNFPKEGEFPMMFVCDPEIKWVAERQVFNFKQFPGYKGTK